MRRTALLFFIGLLTLVQSCSGPRAVRYFSLSELQNYPTENQDYKYDLVVGVKNLDTGLLYHDDRLIYRDGELEVKYWNYARWITTPNVLLAEKLKSSLARENMFKHVIDFPSSTPADLILDGRIIAFEEVDQGAKWSTIVGLEMRIYDSHQQLLKMVRAIEKTPVTDKTAEGVVASIDKGAVKCISIIISSLNGLSEEMDSVQL